MTEQEASPSCPATAEHPHDGEGNHAYHAASDDENVRLLGENVVMDYIRDSPMFRQQTEGFNDCLRGLKDYFTRISSSAEMYAEAGKRAADIGDQLCADLANREYSRSIFTNAHPELGPLSDHVSATIGLIRQVNDLQRSLMERVQMGIKKTLLAFAENELKDMDKLKKEVWRLGDAHEALLLKTLESHDNLVSTNKMGLTKELSQARRRFELARFDMTEYLNHIDGQKKVRMVHGLNRLNAAYVDFFGRGQALCQPEAVVVQARQAALALADENFGQDVESWRLVRSRLEAELQGALPPPGAPLGALSPVFPRQESAVPSYLATLTTEVLGSNSKNASYSDLSHARDEGILKQGYLITTGIFNWNRKRRWYRLHNGKLYYLANNSDNPDPQEVCSVLHADVNLVPGKAPFNFVISYSQPNNGRIELQAENEDDMVKWMTAIRRCKQRFKSQNGGKEEGIQRSSSSLSSSSSTSAAVAVEFAAAASPYSNLIADLLTANSKCCECDDPQVTWASFSIGCVLCEGCASVHRQLGHTTSKLRSLQFDEWPLALIECFKRHLGNDQVNRIWEASVMNGWKRPSIKSPPEMKQEWIIAKYRWYAFVEEDRGNEEVNSRRLIHASAKGDISQAMWCIAHKGSPTWADPQDGNQTALHASTKGGHKDTTLFLLVNGGHAAIRQVDEEGKTPLEIARERRDPVLLQLFVECKRGDYL